MRFCLNVLETHWKCYSPVVVSVVGGARWWTSPVGNRTDDNPNTHWFQSMRPRSLVSHTPVVQLSTLIIQIALRRPDQTGLHPSVCVWEKHTVLNPGFAEPPALCGRKRLRNVQLRNLASKLYCWGFCSFCDIKDNGSQDSLFLQK